MTTKPFSTNNSSPNNSKCNQTKIKKCFPCVVLEMAQHTTGKWKKHPHTTIRLAVKGLVDQKVFEEILKGIGNGYYAIVEIGYLKPKGKKSK